MDPLQTALQHHKQNLKEKYLLSSWNVVALSNLCTTGWKQSPDDRYPAQTLNCTPGDHNTFPP